jgi:hypothetical protein
MPRNVSGGHGDDDLVLDICDPDNRIVSGLAPYCAGPKWMTTGGISAPEILKIQCVFYAGQLENHLQILLSLAAQPAVAVLQYRADHGPRPVLFSRHMELLDAHVGVIYESTEWMAYAPAGLCGTAITCPCVLFVVLYNDREAMRGESLGYNRREELLVARDLVEVTRHERAS